jgi:type IV pilus assembly protein PilY1
MKLPNIFHIAAYAVMTALAIFDPADALAQTVPISEVPLFSVTQQPPLNMLVVGKDHKLFYEAYNDASDLNGDGTLDVGYQPTIDYYGYFDSHQCYAYSGGVFTASANTASKKCPGSWSGDFLNYLTTSRIDALRKVLYGGTRSTDSTTQTIIERAYIPQDAHSWGKEYQSVARDGFDIHDYTPYSAPSAGRYLLFANTTLLDSVTNLRNPDGPPLLRVMQNSPFRIWNWVSIERPVAGDDCFTTSNSRVNCLTGGGASNTWTVVPPEGFSGLTKKQWSLTPDQGGNHSSNETDMNRLFPPNAQPGGTTRTLCGSGPAANIDGTGNQFKGQNGCPNNDDLYLTEFSGTLVAPATGTYTFAVDGDDAVEAYVDGTLVASWYGPHGDCGYCNTHSGTITLTGGNHTVLFRHQEITGGDNYRLMWLPPNAAAASRTDYTVRVEVCNSTYATHELNCKKYTDPGSGAVVYKPTGLLHDYGETDKMKFGLISGSFMHNRQGGVLRKQMGTFTDEIDAATGRFTWKTASFKGIISTLDGIKIDSFERSYSHDYACNSSGWYGPVADGVCRIWGNPIGEMMFETLRYFAGAPAPEPEYTYTNAGSDDATLNMPEVTAWKDPYKTIAQGGLGNLACAKPFETVISDINPEYDSNLPGGAWGGAPTGTLPTKIAGINVGALGDAMWADEGGGTQSVYIGQVGATTDGAPTPKQVSSFGNIRGLSPEEPTKEGSYYSASVAFFGNTTDISDAASDQKMQTFAVAVASPLPHITFPIGSGTMTLVPFAKSVGGNSIDPNGAFQSTDQIVDFYVEKIVNIAGAPTDNTINGGRAYAKFRINYEDIEQGNDHDMDAIASYEALANTDGTVTVNLNSEYAAGSIVQHMGYVISGTTADGIYLEVRDVDTAAGSDPRYRLDTPEGFGPAGCTIAGSSNASTACPTGPSLPLSHSRIFTSGTNAPGVLLKDPLWYAAKYGGFKDANNDGIPDEGEWDAKVSGQPDNYFLVTNALGLRAQLQSAFDSIIANSQPVGSAAASGARFVPFGTLAYQANYLATDWTGDLKAFSLNSDGSLGTPAWGADAKLPDDQTARNIYTAKPSGTPPTFSGVPFTTGGLTTAMQSQVMTGLDTSIYNITDVMAFLRGDQSKEVSHLPPGPFRSRTTRIGDILDSNPTVQFKTGYGYQNLPTAVNGGATGSATYADFIAAKTGVVVYVGANDGMLHAFDGVAGSTGGNELFAFVPNAVLSKVGRLAQPSYSHTYYVDGTPTLGDVYDGSGWRTLLIGATGAGARSVFGLDVTTPSAFSTSNVLWEFNDQNDADMGYGITVPSLPTIAADGTWIVGFGNGYNSARGRAELFVLNALNGTKIAEVDTGIGGTNASASCPLATGPNDCPNGLSSAVVIDSDVDGVGDTIYAGDYLGNLWKFTCTPDTAALTAAHPVHLCTTTWQLGHNGQPLIKAQDSAGNRQPITSGVYAIHNPLGGTLVYFGTGKYLATNDADPAASTLVNSIYAVWDSPYNTGTTLTRGNLMQQTVTGVDTVNGLISVSSNLFDYEPAFPVTGANSRMGWFLDLAPSGTPNPIQGERVIAAPTAILGELLVNAFRPTGDLCKPGGVNTFFELDLLSGAAALQALPGGGGGGGAGIPPGTGGQDLGTGSPLGSPNPVISIPGVPTVPGIGCPVGNPNCITPPPWCTAGMPGYPNCAPPTWCQVGSPGYPACTPPPGCTPATPGYPYDGPCGEPQVCKWIAPGTVVGNLIACRVSWRQMR